MQTETTKELKKEFQITLSKLSHEIRNPIALINSELQLIADSYPQLCSCRQWESLMDNLEYIKELLNEISDFSHAGMISPAPVDPNEFLNSVLSCEKTTLDYLGITLETYMEEIPYTISLDRLKMRQALLNLIRNSYEAIDHPKGKIIVRLAKYDPEKCKNGICISIEDNGCGMTQEQMKHIFSPFVTYKASGTGLGLAVTNEIVSAHQGHITIDSSPDHGSIFRLFLA